jgi:hypothetical protein
VAVTLLTACSADNTEESQSRAGQEDDGLCTVGLRISAAGGNGVTRAADGNATDAEMMNLWTVVVADASGNVKAIHACKPTGAVRQEVDDYVDLTPGTYTFYSFANMAPSVVMKLLGISGTGATGSTVTRNGNDPTSGNGGNENEESPSEDNDNIPRNPSKSGNDDIDSKSDDTVYEIAYAEGAKITATPSEVKTRVDGNGFNPTAAENGFGSKGIPMSNVQTKEITASTTFDLIVVRMMAKIMLQIKNETGASITVKSATLSNVTQNSNGNLLLLPSLTNHDTMEPTHGDIKPNLGYSYQADFTTAVNKTIANDVTHEVTFYVNESARPANAEKLFYLTLEMENVGTSEFRYALISDNAANHWNYIARNDYRIIPVVLDDLKFEIIPYDFPPIGVYPVSVKEVDAAEHIYDFTFHDYGHFHLLPSVTKGGMPVEFSAATPTGSGYKWTLIDNLWDKSWFTYAAKGDASPTANPGGFYRTGTGSTTADGDDEGQTPVWYVNDGTAGPQWAPDATNYRPFIFGYIADPGSALSEDKKVYHEMKIQVYNGTTAYRQMLYRFYMTLSAGQMLYAPSLVAPAPRRPHWQ